MELNEQRKQLLERIHELEHPTTSELKQDETLLEFYEPASIRPTLNQLHKANYLEKQGGRPNKWSVTDDGFQIVKKRRETKKRRLKEVTRQDETITFDNAVERFGDYFSLEAVESELIDCDLNHQQVVIDYRHFEKFDTELADIALDEPREMLEAAETALAQSGSVENNLTVRFANLPEYREKRIRKINSADVGKLITVPGIVLKASITKPILVEATFECVKCGDWVEKKQREGKLTRPYKCDCGNRKFEIKEKTFDDVRILKLQEKPDSPDKKTIKVRVFGSMANENVVTEMKPGTAVRLTGIVEAEAPHPNAKDQYHDLYVSAIDVDEEQNKWEEIELTDHDRERNQEILEYGVVEAFQQSVAADRIIHRDLMKEAFLLYLLGKTEGEGNLNVLVMGEPGTAKSQLNNWAEEFIPKTIKAVAQSATGVGLTATVKEDKDFGGYVAQGGSLTLADGGYHITDEFDKIDPNDVANFNEALASGTITLNKGDITNLKLNANVSEWATANPRNYDYFDPTIPKYEQIPIPPNREATKDRFDVIIGLDTYTADSQEKQDVARHILQRGNPDAEVVQPRFSPDELVKFVTEASRLQPQVTPEAEETIFKVFFSLKSLEQENHRLITNRKLYALKKLSIAYARADLSEEVTEEHAQRACDFFRRSLESIGFEIGKDSFTDINPREKSDKRKIKEAIRQIGRDNGEDAAAIPDISLETGLSEDRIQEVLTYQDNQDEFVNPKGDLWQAL